MNMKLPQQASFGPETYEIGPKVAIWGIRRTGFPPEDSPPLLQSIYPRPNPLEISNKIAVFC